MMTAEGLTSTKAFRLRSLKENQGDIPEAYVNDNECERKCNDLIENFRADFLSLPSNHSMKGRLFLQPANEFGEKKFVCTFIQPTLLPYTELYDLTTCASFVARYCQYEPLEDTSSLEIPVVSPAQTLAWAVGDCFDCSFLLASLLLGAGYDAFVVFGKAPDWIRLKDQSHMQCSLSQRIDNDTSIPWSVEMIIKDECYAQKPSCNDGTHCWVLIKAGKRDLDGGRYYFVEPSTGILYPISNAPYTQVFSVWNDSNCWLNIGDGTVHGIEEFDLNFSNSSRWMPVLPDEHSTSYSWVNALDLPKERFLIRYPDGKRSIILQNSKVELFGEKVDQQGVMSRVIQYEDTARTVVVECNELFFPAMRVDHMIQRTRRPMENMHHEYFSRENECEQKEVGKLRCIKKFNDKTRADGLVKRMEEFGSSITEHFLNRALLRRIVYISMLPKDAKKPKSSELITIGTGMGLAVVERMDEHFEEPADPSKLEKSVACRSYLLKERRIRVTYHCEHEVLRREDVYSKDDVTNDSSAKELIKLENASVSAVKSIQTEMIRLTESTYEMETKMMESSESAFHTGEMRTFLPGPIKKDKVSNSNGSDIDYLSPYLQVENQYLSKEDAMRVKNACLQDTKERSLERANVIQTKLRQEKVENGEADISFRIEMLEKRLAEHEKKATTKYKQLEQKLNEDVRLTSLCDSE